jgi:hypothetical protein
LPGFGDEKPKDRGLCPRNRAEFTRLLHYGNIAAKNGHDPGLTLRHFSLCDQCRSGRL